MKSVQEIYDNVNDVRYTSASGPILDVCRELVKDGRFDEIAESLRLWVGLAPQSELFVRASLPAIVLNWYIAEQDILTFEEFMNWARTTPTWAEQIASSALDGIRLRSTIGEIISSMGQYSQC
jgi:hypothetical protein